MTTMLRRPESTPPGEGYSAVVDMHQRSVVNRLKTARGHINGIVSIIEDDAYCPDVMKQLSAVQGLLEGASRIMLRRHLETCVAKAMQEGRTEEIVDELMETLKFDKTVFRAGPDPGPAPFDQLEVES
jgi:DNA-binding FrmR family transcriptional regulator